MRKNKRISGLPWPSLVIGLAAGGLAMLLAGPRPESPLSAAPARRSAVASMAPRPVPGRAVPAETPGGSARSPDQAEVALFAPWGSADGQLGRRDPEEGAPEGPMSFLVDERGRVLVLDQINQRVQVFENGKPAQTIRLPAGTYQDIRLDQEGNVVLLDRLARRSVEILAADGTIVASFGLEGAGIREGGGTTALFAREDGIWVEVEHQRLVRVADGEGRADPERRQVPGRFSTDGNWLLLAGLQGHQAVAITARPASAPASLPRLFARVTFPLRILQLAALESDGAGRVFLAAHLARFREVEPFDVIEERLEVVLLGPDGTELNRLSLPAPRESLEQYRHLYVTADGTLYQLFYDEAGVSLRRVYL